MSTGCQGSSLGRRGHLPQACRQSTAREAIPLRSTSSASAMATSCSRARGTLPASMTSHCEAVMPDRRAVSSMEWPSFSRTPWISMPKNSPQTWRWKAAWLERGREAGNKLLIYSLLLAGRPVKRGGPGLSYSYEYGLRTASSQRPGKYSEEMFFEGDQSPFNPARYLPTPFHTKYAQQRTALSQYIQQESVGTRMRRWERPF